MHKIAILLLVLALAGATMSSFLIVKAEPNEVFEVPIPTDMPVNPPNMVITSPQENGSYSNGTVYLNFTAHGPYGYYGNYYIFYQNYIKEIQYKGDWMPQETTYLVPNSSDTTGSTPYQIHFKQFNFALKDIPFGRHSLNVTLVGVVYQVATYNLQSFEKMYSETWVYPQLSCSKIINFTVSTNPKIIVPSIQNTTVYKSSVPLNFIIDHAVLEMAYSLDGQNIIPISGNTTLTGLSNGQHNVTVYATDSSGNTYVSDTRLFYVDASKESLIIPLVITLLIVLVGVALISLVYFRRRKG